MVQTLPDDRPTNTHHVLAFRPSDFTAATVGNLTIPMLASVGWAKRVALPTCLYFDPLCGAFSGVISGTALQAAGMTERS